MSAVTLVADSRTGKNGWSFAHHRDGLRKFVHKSSRSGMSDVPNQDSRSAGQPKNHAMRWIVGGWAVERGERVGTRPDGPVRPRRLLVSCANLAALRHRKPFGHQARQPERRDAMPPTRIVLAVVTQLRQRRPTLTRRVRPTTSHRRLHGLSPADRVQPVRRSGAAMLACGKRGYEHFAHEWRDVW